TDPHFGMFLCSCLAAVPSSRPARADASCAGAVKAGRRSGLATSLVHRGHALTGPSTARGLSWSGCDLIHVDALKGASSVKNSPGDAGELVGERDRQHIVVQSLLGCLDPRPEPIPLPLLAELD